MFELDRQIFYFFYNLTSHYDAVDWLVFVLAEYVPLFVISAVIALFISAHRRKKVKLSQGYLLSILVGFLSLMIAKIVQFFSLSQRPFVRFELAPIFEEISYSFPSAHAMSMFSIATGVYFMNRKIGIVLYVVAGLISLARVASGVHYPSDILGGAILGIGLAGLLFGLAKRGK